MICLVVALNSEAKSFLDVIDDKSLSLVAGKPLYTGKVANKKIALCISGIGKVNASIATQLLIDKFNPEYVINFGTAGGMNDSVEIMKYYLIDKCCQYDFDLSTLDNVPVGYIQDFDGIYFNCYKDDKFNLPYSSVSSGDRFNNDLKDITTINDLGCSLRDMEGGAIGQVCTANDVKLIMVKGVSDVFGAGTAQEQFVKNLNSVSHGFKDVIKNLIEKL